MKKIFRSYILYASIVDKMGVHRSPIQTFAPTTAAALPHYPKLISKTPPELRTFQLKVLQQL